MNKEQEEAQARLLKSGDGDDCYFFASDVKGADVAALQKRIKELKDATKNI